MLGPGETDILEKLPIFAALPPQAVRRIAELARRVDLAGPTVVFEEGKPATEMMVVLEGELEVLKRSKRGTEARIALLRPGDVAGEMALIDIQPRSAAVRSLGPASLVVLTNADLATIYREDAAAYTILVLNIAREISRRLRRVDRLLADLLTGVQEMWAAGVDARGTTQ